MTGSLPSGNIFAPLTALGMTSEGRRVVTCSFRVDRIAIPAAEMSAPESGRALGLQESLVAMIYAKQKQPGAVKKGGRPSIVESRVACGT